MPISVAYPHAAITVIFALISQCLCFLNDRMYEILEQLLGDNGTQNHHLER